VDASNLNRQMLFGVKDVGKRKVAAAYEVHTLPSQMLDAFDRSGVACVNVM
jgi:molybdopterin/thiamine biosynthesis adenylyltransferase